MSENEVQSMGPDWIDKGTYWLNIHPQGTEEWHKVRKSVNGKRVITMSNASKAAGRDSYTTKEKYKEEFLNPVRKPQNVHMLRGTLDEPTARRIYEAHTGNKVVEVGMALAKFDPRLGSSVDGMVGEDGIIEIKCPVNIYPKMKIEHYDQMQGSMAITGRKWCDYIQFVEHNDGNATVKIERIPFDPLYWQHDLYPKLCQFLDEVGAGKD